MEFLLFPGILGRVNPHWRLLLVGEETPTSPLDQQQFMAAQIPNCRLAVYPKLGHGVNVIQPERCAQHIREFLDTSVQR